MKKIMKGGGNEVILIIAVLFICIIIGGAVYVVSQGDDLKDCSTSDTTALTEKCKCGDNDCDKDKYCYADETCNDNAKTTSSGSSSGSSSGRNTNGSCSDDSITTESECVPPNTWTPASSPPPPPPPPPTGDPPCRLNNQCNSINGMWTCKGANESTRNPRGFYTKEGGDPQDDDYCNECPESSEIINKGGIGIESCVCNDGYYLDTSTNTCAQCGSDKIYQLDTDGSSGECVCDFGKGYIPDPSNPDSCIQDPDAVSSDITPDDQITLSTYMNSDGIFRSAENLVVDNYPNCLKDNSCMINNDHLLEIYRLIDYSENSQIPQVSGDSCPDGQVLTRNGNLLSCKDSECLLSNGMADARNIHHSAEIYNKIPGVGCIENGSLMNLFTLDDETDPNNIDITLKNSDESDDISAKDVLIDLCSNGKTCNTSTEDSCNGLSTLVNNDAKVRFTPDGGKCSCPPARRSDGGNGDTCEHDCEQDPCLEHNDAGQTIAEITGDGHREPGCDCSQYCINGFSADPHNPISGGECTIDSGIPRDDRHNPPTPENGEGLCFNGSRYNRSWNYTDWSNSATNGGFQGSIKNENGQYLNRSYKTSSTSDWVHECLLPEDEEATGGLNFEYNPFTRYKCKINQYLNVADGRCVPITQSCAEVSRVGTGKHPFVGHYFEYSPQCSFKGGQSDYAAEDQRDPSAPVGTNACCLSCSSQTSHPSRDLIETSVYNSIQMNEILGSGPLGQGYNTRPINYQMTTSGESSSNTNPLSDETDIRQMKKNLFICQKTNFTDNSGTGWGTGDIGMPTTSSYAEANIIGTDIDQDNCKYDSTNNIDGPLNTTCQSTFKYFDSIDRTAGLSERYVWMKVGDEYKFPNETIKNENCPKTIEMVGGGRNIGMDNVIGAHEAAAFASDKLSKWSQMSQGMNRKGFDIMSYDTSTNDEGEPCWCSDGDPQDNCWTKAGGTDSECDGNTGGSAPGHKSTVSWRKVPIQGSVPTQVNCTAQMFSKTDGVGQVWGRILKS